MFKNLFKRKCDVTSSSGEKCKYERGHVKSGGGAAHSWELFGPSFNFLSERRNRGLRGGHKR